MTRDYKFQPRAVKQFDILCHFQIKMKEKWDGKLKEKRINRWDLVV